MNFLKKLFCIKKQEEQEEEETVTFAFEIHATNNIRVPLKRQGNKGVEGDYSALLKSILIKRIKNLKSVTMTSIGSQSQIMKPAIIKIIFAKSKENSGEKLHHCDAMFNKFPNRAAYEETVKLINNDIIDALIEFWTSEEKVADKKILKKIKCF